MTSNFKKLLHEKDKLSKGSLLKYNKFEAQKYLQSGSGLSLHMMRSILQTKIRDLPLKCNFKNAHKDTKCLVAACQGQDETKHIFECNYLSPKNEILNGFLEFEDIYGCDTSKQFAVMNILQTRLQERKKYLAPENKTRGPGGPRKRKKLSLVTREAKQNKKYHKQKGNNN